MPQETQRGDSLLTVRGGSSGADESQEWRGLSRPGIIAMSKNPDVGLGNSVDYLTPARSSC